MSETDSDPALSAWLAQQSGAESVMLRAQRRLGGGAVQDNRLLDVTVNDGTMAGEQRWVLRSDARAPLAISASRKEEFALLERAWRHGVRVPEPLWMCEDERVLGRPFMIMRHVGGEASPRSLVRQAGDGALEGLVAALGAELARIHALPLSDDAEHAPESVDVVAAQLADFRTRLARLTQPQPVLAWALRWLERHPPAPSRIVFAHNDFRTGNLLIDNGQLEAVLDWEFAGPNAAPADIGWFCAPCWRFGGPGEAGGLGSIEAFLQGYEHAGGERPSRDQLDWWIILATLRWAVIALEQGARHDSGAQPDLELALTSHLLPGLELDLLRLIPVDDDVDPTRVRHSANDADGDAQVLPEAWGALSALNEEARDLMEITRQTLKSEIIPALEGDARHSALMVANALSIIARQHYQGESIWHQVRETLSHELSLPMASEDPHAGARALVDEIHRGERDDPDRFEALRHLLKEEALSRARISQPRAAQQ